MQLLRVMYALRRREAMPTPSGDVCPQAPGAIVTPSGMYAMASDVGRLYQVPTLRVLLSYLKRGTFSYLKIRFLQREII